MNDVIPKTNTLHRISPADFGSICRTCLIKENELYDFNWLSTSLNNWSKGIISLEDMLKKWVYDDEDDFHPMFPSKMCLDCCQHFYNINKFFLNCKKSNDFLKKIVEKYENNIIDNNQHHLIQNRDCYNQNTFEKYLNDKDNLNATEIENDSYFKQTTLPQADYSISQIKDHSNQINESCDLNKEDLNDEETTNATEIENNHFLKQKTVIMEDDYLVSQNEEHLKQNNEYCNQEISEEHTNIQHDNVNLNEFVLVDEDSNEYYVDKIRDAEMSSAECYADQIQDPELEFLVTDKEYQVIEFVEDRTVDNLKDKNVSDEEFIEPENRNRLNFKNKNKTYEENLNLYKDMSSIKDFKGNVIICEYPESFYKDSQYLNTEILEEERDQEEEEGEDINLLNRNFIENSKNEHNYPEIDGFGYMCSTCDDSFTNHRDLMEHKRKLGHNLEQIYKCPECDKRFVIFLKFYSHFLTHIGMDDSENEYSISSDVESDSNDSSKFTNRIPYIKPYTCKICNLGLQSEEKLKSHTERIHSLVTCKRCGVTMVKAGKDSHKMFCSVTENSPPIFPCKKCSKKFENHRLLYEHISKAHHKFHVNTKCHICGLLLVNKKTLETHIKKAHRDKLCRICGQSFRYKQAFLKHQLLHAVINKTCTD